MNQGGREHAIKYPLLRRPNLARCLGDNAGRHLTHTIFDMQPRRNLGALTAYFSRAGVDPASVALYEAGAAHADPEEFRMLGGSGLLGPPLMNPHFMVFKLPSR